MIRAFRSMIDVAERRAADLLNDKLLILSDVVPSDDNDSRLTLSNTHVDESCLSVDPVDANAGSNETRSD
jgi:hypothetical protein